MVSLKDMMSVGMMYVGVRNEKRLVRSVNKRTYGLFIGASQHRI